MIYSKEITTTFQSKEEVVKRSKVVKHIKITVKQHGRQQ